MGLSLVEGVNESSWKINGIYESSKKMGNAHQYVHLI